MQLITGDIDMSYSLSERRCSLTKALSVVVTSFGTKSTSRLTQKANRTMIQIVSQWIMYGSINSSSAHHFTRHEFLHLCACRSPSTNSSKQSGCTVLTTVIHILSLKFPWLLIQFYQITSFKISGVKFTKVKGWQYARGIMCIVYYIPHLIVIQSPFN